MAAGKSMTRRERLLALPEVEGLCNAPTKRGRRCGLTAGAQTEHPGEGPCRWHGGMLPTVVAKYARLRALRELPMLGGAIEADPLEALLQCVYRASGIAAWTRLQVEAIESADEVAHGGQLNTWVRMEAEALDRLARFAKDAVNAGVAERQVRIAERTGAKIAAALDEAIAPLDLPPADRTALVQRFVSRLSVLEQADEEPIEGTAAA